MFCPKCGSQIADEAQFCPNCGERISTAGAGTPAISGSAQQTEYASYATRQASDSTETQSAVSEYAASAEAVRRKNKKKGSKALAIAIVLLVAVIGIGGYLIYRYVDSGHAVLGVIGENRPALGNDQIAADLQNQEYQTTWTSGCYADNANFKYSSV